MIKNGKPYSIENGYEDAGLICDLEKDEQEEVMHYVKESFIKANRIMHGRTSYGMKHLIQSATNIYMTNNQFKDLMLICGFETDNVNTLNWEFNVSRKSPAFDKDYIYVSHNKKFYKN